MTNKARIHVTIEYWYDTDLDDYPADIREEPRKVAEMDFDHDPSIVLQSDSTITAAMFGRAD